MSFVKLKRKSNKKKSDDQVTLGAKHEQIMNQFELEKKKIPKKERQIKSLTKELKKLNNSGDTSYATVRRKLRIEDDITKLKYEVENISTQTNEQNYFEKTTDLLLDYYDEEENQVPEQTSKSNGFFDCFCEEKKGQKIGISNFVSREQKNNKGILLDKYLCEVDPNYISKDRQTTLVRICQYCNEEKTLSHSEGSIICQSCGSAEPILIDSEKPNYKEPVPENSYFAYKRINHFKDWLAQFQAKETTEVPQDVYDLILIEIKKARIKNLATLRHDMIRKFLKKLRLNKYYEHIPQITNKLNKLPPPVISREIEEKLCSMFHEIQEPFNNCCPASRKNFLSYSYVLHKMTELLGLDEFKTCFNLLKSREKLKQQDRIWQCICNKLGWQFNASL
jgi:hypothetical protein